MKIEFKDGGIIYFTKSGSNRNNFIVWHDKNGKMRGNVNRFSAAWGNYWFKQAKNLCGVYNAEEMFDFIFFDNCALNNDLDSFSDVYKDLYNVRPHFTREEWANRVGLAQSRQP